MNPHRPIARTKALLCKAALLCKKTLLCAVLFSVQAARASSYPLPWYLTQPTDGSAGTGSQNNASGSLFVANPAAFSTVSSSFGMAESIRSADSKLVNNTVANTSKTTTKTKTILHGIALAQQLGSGFLLGINLSQKNEEQRSKNDNSRYDRLPLEETFLRRELAPKFSLEFSKNFRAGAALRYQYLKATSYGSFSLDPQFSTTYKGTLYGASIGAQIFFDTGGLGLCYFTPLRGKVSVNGESKITTDPGLIFINGFWTPSSNLTMGILYAKHQYENDELAETVPGPTGSNVREILPSGVSPENRFLLIQTVGASIKVTSSSGLGLELSPYFQTGEYEVGSSQKVGEGENAEKQSSFYSAKGGILFTQKQFLLTAGVEYVPRKHKIEDNSGGNREYTFSELTTNASITLHL